MFPAGGMFKNKKTLLHGKQKNSHKLLIQGIFWWFCNSAGSGFIWTSDAQMTCWWLTHYDVQGRGHGVVGAHSGKADAVGGALNKNAQGCGVESDSKDLAASSKWLSGGLKQ